MSVRRYAASCVSWAEVVVSGGLPLWVLRVWTSFVGNCLETDMRDHGDRDEVSRLKSRILSRRGEGQLVLEFGALVCAGSPGRRVHAPREPTVHRAWIQLYRPYAT